MQLFKETHTEKHSNKEKINWILDVACHIKHGVCIVSGRYPRTTSNLPFCSVTLANQLHSSFGLRKDKGNSNTVM